MRWKNIPILLLIHFLSGNSILGAKPKIIYIKKAEIYFRTFTIINLRGEKTLNYLIIGKLKKYHKCTI